jgi:hypothetical protein
MCVIHRLRISWVSGILGNRLFTDYPMDFNSLSTMYDTDMLRGLLYPFNTLVRLFEGKSPWHHQYLLPNSVSFTLRHDSPSILKKISGWSLSADVWWSGMVFPVQRHRYPQYKQGQGGLNQWKIRFPIHQSLLRIVPSKRMIDEVRFKSFGIAVVI